MPDRKRDQLPSYAPEVKWRHRFTVFTAAATVLLLGWGAFVTSINAGLAVPDWPSSFNSYDPFNPWPDWWKLTPVLAEHGHRLLGALVGALTLVLAAWTWFADPRRWTRWLAVGMLVLVSLQGVLGGLRVVLISLDLAVVHACVAQIFFAMIIGMSVFTSQSWLRSEHGGFSRDHVRPLRRLSILVVAVLYVQIILGAILRHPGTGIDTTLVLTHFAGALVSSAVIISLYVHVHRYHRGARILAPAARTLLVFLGLQFALGVTAYFVTLDDSGMLEPSNIQVVVNTAHMVTGALLMGSAAATLFGSYHLPHVAKESYRMESAESVILQ